MNYNAKPASRQSIGRKVKRVSDVNSMGYNPHDQANGQPPNIYPNLPQTPPNYPAAEYTQQPQQAFNQQQQYAAPNMAGAPPAYTNFNSAPNIYPNTIQTPQLGVFGQPIVQDMAMQYGQQLAGVGKTMLKQEVERFVPVTKLKYYFAVDTKYVLSKLTLLFFPFRHSDWSLKYEQDGPVQPRFEINAPDLYIPTMAYVTYVLVAGLVLGMQKKFSPEQIGILASSALAWCVVELAIYSCILYVIQVQTSLRSLDLLAYSGYKFVGTIFSVTVSLLAGKTGYYVGLVYCNLALAFFLVRSLKAQILADNSTSDQSTGYYTNEGTSSGNKRRLYFLLFIAAVQPVLSWWLSFHLIGASVPLVAIVNG